MTLLLNYMSWPIMIIRENKYCIVFAGYEFTFPFLADECGITIEDNIVKPLYKHVLNTTHPSMGFIGIPFLVCPFPLFDFQVSYSLSLGMGICFMNSDHITNIIQCIYARTRWYMYKALIC